MKSPIQQQVHLIKEVSLPSLTFQSEPHCGQEVEKISEGLILEKLPKHLKYAFLGAERAQPIIIAADLAVENE